MAMEIPVLEEYFENVSEVRDARFGTNVLWSVNSVMHQKYKVAGKPLMDELSTLMKSQPYRDKDNFIDIGRIKLNRKKQKEGVYALKSLCNDKSYLELPMRGNILSKLQLLGKLIFQKIKLNIF